MHYLHPSMGLMSSKCQFRPQCGVEKSVINFYFLLFIARRAFFRRSFARKFVCFRPAVIFVRGPQACLQIYLIVSFRSVGNCSGQTIHLFTTTDPRMFGNPVKAYLILFDLQVYYCFALRQQIIFRIRDIFELSSSNVRKPTKGDRRIPLTAVLQVLHRCPSRSHIFWRPKKNSRYPRNLQGYYISQMVSLGMLTI